MGGAGRLEVVCQNRDILFGEGASNKPRFKEVKKDIGESKSYFYPLWLLLDFV